MENNVSYNIVEKWLKAWSLSRELSPPIKFKSGFKLDVGYEKQKSRYVFSELNNDFIYLSQTITEPWIFLKVCISPDKIKNLISEKWQIQPQGYMMFCFQPINFKNKDFQNLSFEYKLQIDNYGPTYIIKIFTKSDEFVSIGRITIIDDLAVYDRISVEENHRRKGLATYLINELEKIALSKNVFKNFLVATEEGKLLYESLGWELYSFFTSIVITD